MAVQIADDAPEELAVDLVEIADRAVGIVLEAERPEGKRSIDVVLAGDSLLTELNQDFRQRVGPTDVISFPFEEQESPAGPPLLGEVYVSLPRALSQAEQYGATLEEEVARLVIHGALHVLGYDHIDSEDAEVMKALEERLWREWRAS